MYNFGVLNSLYFYHFICIFAPIENKIARFKFGLMYLLVV